MCRAEFRRVESGAMEPESEKSRNVPEDSSKLPPQGLCGVALLGYIASLGVLSSAAAAFSSASIFVVALLLGAGIGLLGIARSVSYLDRLVQLREWELTRQLKKEE